MECRLIVRPASRFGWVEEQPILLRKRKYKYCYILHEVDTLLYALSVNILEDICEFAPVHVYAIYKMTNIFHIRAIFNLSVIQRVIGSNWIIIFERSD